MTEPDFLRATRASYDAIATDYAAFYQDVLAVRPIDRAMLGAFAELVGDSGPVADVGSGPGLVTALLDELGLDVFGVDLSPEMVALARRTHPGLRFEEGSMLALGGLVANYSIIHLPMDLVPEVFAEFHRVLAPGGHLWVAFQVGDEPLRLREGFGRSIELDFHRRRPDDIAELLVKAGFAMNVRLVREPREGSRESTQQAILLARKPRA